VRAAAWRAARYSYDRTNINSATLHNTIAVHGLDQGFLIKHDNPCKKSI
jgi:hypothetical protein